MLWLFLKRTRQLRVNVCKYLCFLKSCAEITINLSLQINRFLIPSPIIGRGLFYFGEFRVQQQAENSVDRPKYSYDLPVLRKNMAIVASLSAEKFLQKNKVLILNELGLFKLSKFSDARLMPSLCYFENPIQTRFTIIKNAIKKPIIAPKEPISNRPAIVLTTTKTNPPIPIIAGMDLLSFLPYNSNFACQGFC